MDSLIINPFATPAYVPFDPNAPNGATQAPDVYAASDLANMRALRDAVVCGYMPGYAYSISGGTNAAPTYRIWSTGVIAFRMWAVTYDATITYLPLTIKWQWSNDNGASWADMDATATVLTWDTATNIKLLTVSRDAGLWCLVLNALICALYAGSNLAGHAGLTGTAVHGLGTMATQNANAVNITGGNLGPVIIAGGSQYNNSSIQACTRLYPAASPTIANGSTWDWAATPTHCTHPYPTPAYTLAGIANPQVGEVKRLYCYAIQSITINNSSGVNIFWQPGMTFGPTVNVLSFVCINTNNVAVFNMTAGGPSNVPV